MAVDPHVYELAKDWIAELAGRARMTRAERTAHTQRLAEAIQQAAEAEYEAIEQEISS